VAILAWTAIPSSTLRYPGGGQMSKQDGREGRLPLQRAVALGLWTLTVELDLSQVAASRLLPFWLGTMRGCAG
jgi:hypothetical protein